MLVEAILLLAIYIAYSYFLYVRKRDYWLKRGIQQCTPSFFGGGTNPSASMDVKASRVNQADAVKQAYHVREIVNL